MNGAKYLVDTNCFIHLLNEKPLISPFIFDVWAFSYITEIELLCKKNLPVDEDSLIRDLPNECYKVEHSQLLTELVIDLTRNNNIKLPDAIIAASAQLLQLPLLTTDKGFAKINNIDCIVLDFE